MKLSKKRESGSMGITPMAKAGLAMKRHREADDADVTDADSVAALPDDTPAWAIGMVRTLTMQMQTQMQNQMQLVQNLERKMDTKMAEIDIKMANCVAKLSNGRVKSGGRLEKVQTDDGRNPDGFPEFLDEVGTLSGDSLNDLLRAYGVNPPQSIEARRLRFAAIIGVDVQPSGPLREDEDLVLPR